jgi:hypothetical protein
MAAEQGYWRGLGAIVETQEDYEKRAAETAAAREQEKQQKKPYKPLLTAMLVTREEFDAKRKEQDEARERQRQEEQREAERRLRFEYFKDRCGGAIVGPAPPPEYEIMFREWISTGEEHPAEGDPDTDFLAFIKDSVNPAALVVLDYLQSRKK